jgi:hypothetical protein
MRHPHEEPSNGYGIVLLAILLIGSVLLCFS